MASKHYISPVRFAVESLLGWFGFGPRHSRFSPARHPESRMRFAQYVSRVQPPVERAVAKRKAEMLGRGGALSNGAVRHAAPNDSFPVMRSPGFSFVSPARHVAARRHFASVRQTSSLLRSMLNALRAR